MKHIKLFESFDSKAITSILSFLSRKVNKEQYNNFINTLNELSKEQDIDLNKLTDKQIKYLSYNKAIIIDKEYDENEKDDKIYCIKYWFSINNGFLEKTGVGSKKIYFNDKEFMNDGILSNASRKFKISGLLKKVESYDEIDSGDKILMMQDNSLEGYDDEYIQQYHNSFICYGIAYKHSNENLYVYTNDFDNSSPSVEDGNRDNKREYDGCVLLGDNTRLKQKHVYKLIPDDKTLRVEKSKDIEKSIWDYNLLYNRSSLEGWDSDNQEKLNRIKESEFAIVLFLEDIIKDNIKKSLIVKNRDYDKLGATILIDNDSHRKINIERYLDKMFTKYGFESGQYKKINNLISLVSKSIFIEDSSLKSLEQLSLGLERITDLNNYEKANELIYVKKYFTHYKKITNRNKEINDAMSIVNNSNNHYIKSIINKVMNLSKVVNEMISKSNINNVYDFTIIVNKLILIESLSKKDIYKFEIRFLLERLLLHTRLKKMLEETEYNIGDYKSDINRLSKLESAIRNILK